MKNTMSKRNVAKFHKLLEAKAPMKDCVAILKVSAETLKKFTPGKVQDFKNKQAERAKLAEKQEKENQEAADTLAKAAKKVTKKD